MTSSIPTPVTENHASEAMADTTGLPANSPELIPLSIHLLVDARGVALGILATVALLFALDWTQPFLITLFSGFSLHTL